MKPRFRLQRNNQSDINDKYFRYAYDILFLSLLETEIEITMTIILTPKRKCLKLSSELPSLLSDQFSLFRASTRQTGLMNEYQGCRERRLSHRRSPGNGSLCKSIAHKRIMENLLYRITSVLSLSKPKESSRTWRNVVPEGVTRIPRLNYCSTLLPALTMQHVDRLRVSCTIQYPRCNVRRLQLEKHPQRGTGSFLACKNVHYNKYALAHNCIQRAVELIIAAYVYHAEITRILPEEIII